MRFYWTSLRSSENTQSLVRFKQCFKKAVVSKLLNNSNFFPSFPPVFLCRNISIGGKHGKFPLVAPPVIHHPSTPSAPSVRPLSWQYNHDNRRVLPPAWFSVWLCQQHRPVEKRGGSGRWRVPGALRHPGHSYRWTAAVFCAQTHDHTKVKKKKIHVTHVYHACLPCSRIHSHAHPGFLL